MRVCLIGGGVSSCILACYLKYKNPSIEIDIYESSNAILKRVLVSGNGRCNFFNKNFTTGKLENIFNSSTYSTYFSTSLVLDFLNFIHNHLGLEYITDSENRMYPFSNTSSTVKYVIEKELKRAKVNVILNSKVSKILPKFNQIVCNDKTITYDYLYLGVGGVSYDRSFNNENLLNDLQVKFEKQTSSLTPLITFNSIPSYLVGTRVKGEISLYENNKLIFLEDGELLFKKDGLSGICIFDSSLFINDKNNYYIKLNPFKYKDNKIDFTKDKNIAELSNILNPNLVNYLSSFNKKTYSYQDILNILTFKIKGKYSLKDGQISSGGILLSEIDSSLKLKRYSNIYVGGEIINLHAICGGYNMGLAFLAGFKVAKEICKHIA